MFAIKNCTCSLFSPCILRVFFFFTFAVFTWNRVITAFRLVSVKRVGHFHGSRRINQTRFPLQYVYAQWRYHDLPAVVTLHCTGKRRTHNIAVSRQVSGDLYCSLDVFPTIARDQSNPFALGRLVDYVQQYRLDFRLRFQTAIVAFISRGFP